MATAVRPLNSRDPSVTRLECDVNPNFTFPAQPHARSQSLLPGDPPAFQFPAFPPRRGSVPLNNVGSLATAAVNTARPKSSCSNTLLLMSDSAPRKGARAGLPGLIPPAGSESSRGQQKPYYFPGGIGPGARTLGAGTTPTILNASLNTKVTVGPVPELAEVRRHDLNVNDMLGGSIALESREDDTVSATPPVTEKAAPKRASPPPGGARRGHAHRRSGAISSGDVWSILSQSAPNLPLTCAEGNGGQSTDSLPQPISSAGNSPLLSWSAPVSPGFNGPSSLPSPTIPPMDYDSAMAADRRNRVHFIDRVEIIPRPMSAGTETSSITVKGHSGTDSINSISSILPFPPNSPRIETAPALRHGRTRSNSQTLLQPTSALRATTDRPSTAGAILLTPPGTVADGEVVVPSLMRPATASPPLSIASDGANASPTKPPPGKKMHKKSLSDYSPLAGTVPFSDNRHLSSDKNSDDSPSAAAAPSEPTGKKQKKRKSKKQIKNWAGTILGKSRGLRHSSKRQLRGLPRRSPTPPLPRSEQRPGDNEWVSAAWNESYVLMPVDDSQGLNSSSENIVMDVLAESPIIDLDAALGPFQTPTGPNAGFAAARRRRMHSAVGLKGNGYFHRRSESMPEMQLFSLSEHDDDGHMADVCEEDEEDEDEEDSEESEDDEEEGKTNIAEGLGIGVRVVDGDGANWQEGIVMEWGSDDMGEGGKMSRRGSAGDGEVEWRNEGSLFSANNSPNPGSSTTSVNSVAPEIEIEPPTPCISRKGAPADIITPLTSAQSSSSLTSSSTVTSQHQICYPQPLDSPSTFVTAVSNPNTPLQLDFPSEYADSASSFDPYTDFLGEPGPEMRMGADDVPSLTSSSSTMTIGGTYAAMPSTPGMSGLAGLSSVPGKEGRERKEAKSKRWSKVWAFWKLK